MADPANVATPTTKLDPAIAIHYALLVQMAEKVQPNQTVYNPGTPINVTYDSINVNYKAVATVDGNDLATGIGSVDPAKPVSFGFIAQDSAGNVVVAVRGTANAFEWAQDARFLPVKCPILPGAGFTAEGFTAVYKSLRIRSEAGSPLLVSGLSSMKFPQSVTSLTICGHSLGGALVTLMALDVVANTKLPSPTVYSYASPRTGNGSFVDTYNQLVPKTFRIFNRYDSVPTLPPLYDHVLQPYELNDFKSVKADLACQHHLTTYLHLLSLQTGGTRLPLNPECVPA